MKTSIHLLNLFVGLSTLVELAENWKQSGLEATPRALARSRCGDPTELLPVLGQSRAGLAAASSALASSGFQNACPLVQRRASRVTSRQHQWQRGLGCSASARRVSISGEGAKTHSYLNPSLHP